MIEFTKSVWTPEMDEFVRKNYGVLSWGEMAQQLGLSREVVKWRGTGMGLTKEKGCMAHNARDNEYMEKVQREIYG